MTEPASVPAGAGEVGAELARARQAAGLAIADVSQQLKFAARQIEALEQGRYAELPPGMFARGMVRAYARLVKVDPEPLVERIAAQVAVPDSAVAIAAARRPIPIVDSARRTNLAYAALTLAVLLVIGAIVFEWQRESSRAAKLSFVPAAQAPAEPQRTAASATSSPLSPEVVTLASQEPPAVQEKMTPEKSETSAGRKPAAGGRHRIVMKFERESWVEIRGRDGKVLTSELNPGGSERSVEGIAPFTLVIGNAHHVRLSYDDRLIDLAPHVKVEVARFTLE